MAQDLFTDLHARGIRLRLSETGLEVVAPAGALTPELRERLRLNRDELISMLRRAAPEEDVPQLTPQPAQWHEPFPLTDIQHAYWVGRGAAVELGGVSSHYYFELEREGLDPERLSESLRKVIARHDMLRMTVRPDGQQQILRETPEYRIQVADLRALPDVRRAAELARIRAEMDHQVLPGNDWPLFDIRASLLDASRIRLHISLDVLIMDGFSLYLLFQEWRRFYEEPDWRPEPLFISYRDLVLHQAAERESSRHAADEAYWLDRLDSLPPAPALPLAKQPGRLERTRFTRRARRLNRDQWSQVKQAAQGRGLTPSSVLMAAFAEVLRRWSAQPGFTLNLTLFNRPSGHPQIEQLIGDFTSVTLLEVAEPAEQSFTARAEGLRRQLLQDLEHASYSGVRVLRERARRLGGGPAAAMPVVFTSALVLGSSDGDPSQGIRFFGEERYAITQTPQVWLDHQVAEEQGELVYNWDFVAELFPDGLVDDMFSAYHAVLERLSSDQNCWDQVDSLAELPQWQTEERALANATDAAIPARTLCDLVEEQAERSPETVAVISGDVELSYAATVSYSRRLARRLIELGASANSLVGVVLDKGWQQVPAVIGVNQSGAAYLPIDPQWPEARRHQLLEQGQVRLVVTTLELSGELAWPRDVHLVTFEDPELRAADAGALATSPRPEDLAYVIFTSGSTGRPKGVMIDHRGAANTVQDINSRFEVGPGDRVLALSALSFDLSVYDVFGLLAAGGAVVLPDPAKVHDPAHWAELMDRHGVTVWNSVPALMQAWVDSGHAPDGLRLVLLSGDWIPVSLPDAIRSAHPQAQPISLGGATEASIWSIDYPIGKVPEHWTSIPYGKPLANQTMEVLDHRLRPCPVWAVGEIHIGGVGVAKGYWADPEQTAERFIDDPRTDRRRYRTGDLGRYLPGGDIEFLGRADSQVKLNGYRIELGEITAALRRRPGVAGAAVDVSTNPATGRRQLVAYVVPDQAGDRTAESPAGLAAWRRVLESGEAEVRRGLRDLGARLGTYRGVWRAVEELCPLIMARTLSRLGFFHAEGDTATLTEIAEQEKLKPGHVGLVRQWLSVLADAGRLVPGSAPGEFRCATAFDAEQLDERIRHGLAELRQDTDHRVLVNYVAGCADKQTELLRGEVSPLELLLPGGSSAVTDALYADNPVSHLQNRVAARAVRALVDRCSPDRPVRILEVGAGTGATTALVLRELPTGRVHYTFTDVSTYFTERAKPRFRAYPFVDYGVFNIDRDPAGQGFAAESADIVIAANVLHDAEDLDRTLRHLRSVLAPGGTLLCIEGTANSLVQMITVGFIEGLGNYQDQRELPLLTVPQWSQRMESAGFTRFATVPQGNAAVDVHIQHVLLSGVPEGRPRVEPEDLRQELDSVLPDYMVPRHYLLVDRLPLSANGKVDLSALPSPWTETTAEERVEPRDDTERLLYGIWCEALGRQDFGVEDNFFELGGDSLHAVTILGRLRDEFGLEVAADEGLELLFDRPTIAEFSLSLREGTGS